MATRTRKPKGRMIRVTISDSDKFAALSPEAAVLFCMLIPHLNSHGKLNGGAGYVKDEVCPKVQYLTLESIPALLQEINDRTNVKWFTCGGRKWLHSINDKEHQDLTDDRKGMDVIPSYSGATQELLRSSSGVTPPEVEVEYKSKGNGTPPVQSLSCTTQLALEKLVEVYPSDGLRVGLEDGAAAAALDDIPVSEHGQVVIAAKAYAAEVAEKQTPAQYVRSLASFLRRSEDHPLGFWRNHARGQPLGAPRAREELLDAARDTRNLCMPALSEASEREFRALNIKWSELRLLVSEGQDPFSRRDAEAQGVAIE